MGYVMRKRGYMLWDRGGVVDEERPWDVALCPVDRRHGPLTTDPGLQNEAELSRRGSCNKLK